MLRIGCASSLSGMKSNIVMKSSRRLSESFMTTMIVAKW